MPAAKVSLTLDQSLLVAARQRAGRRGLSRYVNEALRRHLQRDPIVGLLDALEREHGAIGAEVMHEVRQAWPDPVPEAQRDDLEALASGHSEVWIQPL